MASLTRKKPDRQAQADRPAAAAPVQLFWIAALAILAIFIAQLWAYFTQGYYAGVDEATYFLTAKALAIHNSPAVHSADPLLFMPANMNELRPGVFYQKYPIGFPLLVAIGYKIAGQLGAFLVNPILGCVALAGALALAWELAGKWAAILLGFLLALHPLMVCYSTSALSHMTDLACVVWGLWFLWRWGERGGPAWALGAGLLLGYAVSIRYTEAVLALVVLWVTWNRIIAIRRSAAPLPPPVFRGRAGEGVHGSASFQTPSLTLPGGGNQEAAPSHARVLLELGVTGVGATVALIPLMVFHWATYGSPLRTGYGLTRESTAFSWQAFASHAGLVLKDLFHPGFGLPALVVLSVAGLLVWVVRCFGVHSSQRRNAKIAEFLLLWILPTLLLYTAYYWSSPYPTLYMRLFLNAMVGIAVAAVVVIGAIGRNRRWLAWALAASVIAAGLIGRLYPLAGEAGVRSADDTLLASADLVWIAQEGTVLARATVPADAVLIADDWMAYPAVFATDCQILSPGDFDEDQVAKRMATAAGPGPLELNPLRASRYFPLVSGKSQSQLDALLRQEIRSKLAEGRMVALLTPDRSLNGPPDPPHNWARRLSPDLGLKQIATSQNAYWRVYQIFERPSNGP
jgi:hypothetical protein